MSQPTKAGNYDGIHVLDVYATDPSGAKDYDLDRFDWSEQWEQARTWIRVVVETQAGPKTLTGHQWQALGNGGEL